MRSKFNKLLIPIFAVILSFTLASCGATDYSPIVIDCENVGTGIFELNKSSDEVTVIFFDDDNVVSEDGTSYARPKRQVSNTIGSSDCYMVKSGTTELLVDGGYQSITSYGSVTSSYAYNDEYVKSECQENLLKKIAAVISSDGVLDYLIVTHADFDHIAALIANGGIFDAFINHRTIVDFDGNSVTLKKINYLIDFDSGLVKKFSDESIDKSKRLVRSDYYQAYVNQRSELIENGTSYCPASAFFDNNNIEKYGYSISDENRNVAMPDAIITRLSKVNDSSSVQYILDENYDNGITAIKDEDYSGTAILSDDLGSLSFAKTTSDEERYFYQLPFNGGSLRILYNWHYDFIYHSSFNQNDSGDDSTQAQDPSENVYDSQDANNISVCFEITKDTFKFLSCGDLGGNGENGLLKYYDGTDVLSNVSLFKVSHHGSIYNGENSSNLFKLAKPQIIVITGCASYKDSSWKSSDDDMVVSAMVGRTKLNQKLFDNISQAYSNEKNQPMIMCTNINSYRNVSGVSYFESAPFYGDIMVRFSGGQLHVSTSYCGQIKPYISQKFNSEYYQQNNCEFVFSTRSDKTILSLQDTEWFKKVGFVYGGN